MSLGERLFKGAAWSGIERISIQLAQSILAIVIARLVTPEEYGIFSILVVFTSISQVFVDSGFTKALIQKKEKTHADKSTVFVFNISVSILFYGLLWVASPFIAQFYETEELSILLKVIALSLIINAIYAVQSTLVSISLNFKLLAKINLISTLVSGGIAVYLAYIQFGVWALVYQIIIRSVVNAILIQFAVKWRPSLVFSSVSFKQMFSYGSKLLISSLLARIFSNINAILIGKYVGTKDLGFYSRGIQFADIGFNVFNSAINNVLLPGLSPYQDQRDLLISHTRKIIKTTALVVVPFFLSLLVLAEPVIRVLLTEKWLPAVFVMQIFCVARLISIISGVNVNLLYVIGRTDLSLRQQYINIPIRIVLLVAALQYGIFYIALAELTATIFHFFVNTYYPGKIMGYGPLKQIKDLAPILFSGIIMAIALFVLSYVINNDILNLCLAPIVILIVYIGLLKLFRVPELEDLLGYAKGFLRVNKMK